MLPGPTAVELNRLFSAKYGLPQQTGWGPAMRLRHGYFSPDDLYEALVDRLVGTDSRWLDVGCGRHLFPHNEKLATELAERCDELVGVDPDASVLDNPFVHVGHQMSFDEFEPTQAFDVVTMRMVAEHVEDPVRIAATLARCVTEGGRVVIYTPHGRGPIPLLNRFVPGRLRHWIKRALWGTEERDTFPAFYRMNSQRRLRELFDAQGFSEVGYWCLDNCGTLGSFRVGLRVELTMRRILRRLGLPYPMACLIGVYERPAPNVLANHQGQPEHA